MAVGKSGYKEILTGSKQFLKKWESSDRQLILFLKYCAVVYTYSLYRDY